MSATHFIVKANSEYSIPNINAYCHCEYIPSRYLNHCRKASYVQKSILELKCEDTVPSIQSLLEAKNIIEQIIAEDVRHIIAVEQLKTCVLVAVPRAKSESYYEDFGGCAQYFRQAVSNAAKKLNMIDGSNAFYRHTDTKTTHRKNHPNNDGCSPYPGITTDTCAISTSIIKDHNIVLIDDIYTECVFVDEDAIVSILNNGAKKIIFYSVCKTVAEDRSK